MATCFLPFVVRPASPNRQFRTVSLFRMTAITREHLHGMSVEELRFYRLIEDRQMNPDGTQDVTLACGHMLLYTIPTKNDEVYAPCAECLRDYVSTWGSLRLKL
jgi:hypothetical protein